MFCCAPPSIRKSTESKLCITLPNDIPSKSYLPKYTEHKIQKEPGFVIDDPSSIFYDPDEKAGFVYHSASGHSYENELDKTEAGQTRRSIGERSLDSSLDFDDSLDLISIEPTTPSVKDASFDRGYDDISRRPSSEQEAGYSEDEATYHSYNVDVNKTPPNLLLSSTHGHIPNLRINEDSGYSSARGQRQRKDAERNYTSDAESTNKYQDSGIYEDEVFSDLSKHPSEVKLDEDGFLHDGELEMDEFIPGQSERLSAFKTPSSSPQKLQPDVELTRLKRRKSSPKGGRLNRFLQKEREEREIITNGIYNCNNDDEKQRDFESMIFHDLWNASKTTGSKSTSKYSHVQPRVQTRRKSSTSPGRTTPKSTSPGRQTPSESSTRRGKSKEPKYKPMHFGRPKIDNQKLEFKKKAKAKVGSMENVYHTPGGGQNKVFKQKLEFKKNAEPRTDTHGVETYSNLPQEFQEIARRLARQDHQLKLGSKQNTRGRLTSRSSSTAASSRASSISPTRGRSKTRRPTTPSLPLQKTTAMSYDSLSRSSSIRSIPTTPNLHSKHPATSSILYDKKTRSRPGSPTSSRPQSPARSCCSSRANSPMGFKSRSRSKSRSRPGTPKSGESQATTPVRQLYQFAQTSTFMPGSPKVSGSQPMFQFVPVR
eukprot:gene3255-3736_t